MPAKRAIAWPGTGVRVASRATGRRRGLSYPISDRLDRPKRAFAWPGTPPSTQMSANGCGSWIGPESRRDYGSPFSDRPPRWDPRRWDPRTGSLWTSDQCALGPPTGPRKLRFFVSEISVGDLYSPPYGDMYSAAGETGDEPETNCPIHAQDRRRNRRYVGVTPPFAAPSQSLRRSSTECLRRMVAGLSPVRPCIMPKVTMLVTRSGLRTFPSNEDEGPVPT